MGLLVAAADRRKIGSLFGCWTKPKKFAMQFGPEHRGRLDFGSRHSLSDRHVLQPESLAGANSVLVANLIASPSDPLAMQAASSRNLSFFNGQSCCGTLILRRQ